MYAIRALGYLFQKYGQPSSRLACSPSQLKETHAGYRPNRFPSFPPSCRKGPVWLLFWRLRTSCQKAQILSWSQPPTRWSCSRTREGSEQTSLKCFEHPMNLQADSLTNEAPKQDAVKVLAPVNLIWIVFNSVDVCSPLWVGESSHTRLFFLVRYHGMDMFSSQAWCLSRVGTA